MAKEPAHLTPVLRAVADPTRRAVLEYLRDGEQTVGAIVSNSRMTQPAMSQHLRVLLDVGLVRRRREGRRQFYGLTPEPLRHVSDWVQSYAEFWNTKLDALGAYLDREDVAPEKKRRRKRT